MTETPAAHVRNALQILSNIDPMGQAPAEVEKDILAAEARLLTALTQLEGPTP